MRSAAARYFFVFTWFLLRRESERERVRVWRCDVSVCYFDLSVCVCATECESVVSEAFNGNNNKTTLNIARRSEFTTPLTTHLAP